MSLTFVVYVGLSRCIYLLECDLRIYGVKENEVCSIDRKLILMFH